MWGQERKTSDIVLDDRVFAVRNNLFDLLLRLPVIKSRSLWVDAICIDQASIHERNHQVSLMEKIYSQAKNVIVWLGDDDEEITEVIKRAQPSQGQNDDDDDSGDPVCPGDEDNGGDGLSPDETRKRLLRELERDVRRLRPSILDNAELHNALMELELVGEPFSVEYKKSTMLIELSALCKDPY